MKKKKKGRGAGGLERVSKMGKKKKERMLEGG